MSYAERFSTADGDFLISDERELLDFEILQVLLGQTYWTPGISMEQLRRQVDNSSLAFGLYEIDPEEGPAPLFIRGQVGFARVISDLTRFAYLSDVIIKPELQRRGLGQRLVEAALAHPELKDVKRWTLMTDDAHGVYEKLGFSPLGKPERWMEKKHPGGGQWL
ncbi:GNAT family N-acetyltransferase [bacterium]|nr:GNAT family N-acetyltransferase [bacterium]